MKYFKLSNGQMMPAVGLGTWKAQVGMVGEAVKTALKVGYHHIDGALIYQNEKEIGQILKKWKEEGGKRVELFYTSKLWNHNHRPDTVEMGITQTLNDLQLDHLDLYLMHWPISQKFVNMKVVNPVDKESGKVLLDDTPIEETWKAMEKLVEKGLTKSIGVCNFTIKNLERILKICKIPPVVNQVEMHPWNPQPTLLKYCKEKNILITAYSPLGSGGEPSLLQDEIVVDVAKKRGITPAQVLISWAVCRGTSVIPKSVTPSRIESNLQVVELDKDEMARLDSIGYRKRFVNPSKFFGVDVFEDGNNPEYKSRI